MQVPAAGWTQWFLFIGLIEKGLPTRSPGDYKNAGAGGWVVALWCFFGANFSTLGGRIIQGENLSLGTKLFERENILQLTL